MAKQVLALGLVCLGLMGCGKKEEPREPTLPAKGVSQEPTVSTKTESGKLTVLCGGSFRPPMEELKDKFEKQTGVKVDLSFGQSEDLLPQVKIGKMGDVFVTHDPYLKYTQEAGALLEGVQVGYVAPVLVVRKGNPAGVRALADLARPELAGKVALPDPQFSTCGEMLARLLKKKGLWAAALKNAEGAVFRSQSETGNALKLGTREVGVMWNGTAHNFLDTLEIIPTPYEYDETIRVWVMGLSYSPQPDLVKQFLEFCKTEGRKVFAAHGYVKEVAPEG